MFDVTEVIGRLGEAKFSVAMLPIVAGKIAMSEVIFCCALVELENRIPPCCPMNGLVM
jgi:hypothetical protein